MKDSVRKLLSLILLAVFLVSVTLFVLNHFDKQENEQTYLAARELAGLTEDLAPTAAPTEVPTEPSETVPEATEPVQTVWIPAPVDGDPYFDTLKHTNLDALRKQNEDVVGWIRIPDTRIDYPIVQGEDNRYYLSHTWNDSLNAGGAIFLEVCNSTDFTDFNTILYGHNMRNGSMFAGLHDFSTATYREQHPYIYLVTDEGILRYEIFSSYNAQVDSQTYGLSFRQTETREEFIAMALENSEIDAPSSPAITDRILTLSTCTGLGYGERRVVHAYLPMIPVQ